MPDRNTDKQALTREELLGHLADDLAAADDPTEALVDATMVLVEKLAHATACQPGSFASAYEERCRNLIRALGAAGAAALGMTDHTNPSRIAVNARRWRDSNGNTYFSADIAVDGEHVHRIPYSYGYGTHYVDEAFAWLDAQGITRRDGREAPWRYCDRAGIALETSHVDVRRKKDL